MPVVGRQLKDDNLKQKSCELRRHGRENEVDALLIARLECGDTID